MFHKLKKSWHYPLILHPKKVVWGHLCLDFPYVMEYFVSIFAFASPNKLDVLILQQVNQKVCERHQVIFSASGFELKLILCSEYHIASENITGLLFHLVMLRVREFLSKPKVHQSNLAQGITAALFVTYQNIV
jgi:hypothetical protein